jgi:hypothetical protein
MTSKHARTTTPFRKAAIAAGLCLAGLSTQAQAASDWDWGVAPYVWMVTINTDLERTVPPAGGISNDTNFDGVLDKIDGGFLIHAEGQGDEFGVFSDFIFLGLADENEFPRFNTSSDLDARMFELAGVWSPGPERYHGFEVFAGLRYIDVDLAVEFDPIAAGPATTTFDGGKSYSDFMLGARYTAELSQRWSVVFRGDGSWGATEGSWNASAVAQFKMNHGAWLFGYRYFSVDFGDDNSETTLELSGPEIGYAFAF